MKSINQIIASHPFVKGMEPEHIAVLARHAYETKFTPGQTIFREGKSAYQFYLILDGKVAVTSHISGGESLQLQTIEGGDVLGWSWLFPPFSWVFQARALAPTTAVLVDGGGLLVACEEVHAFGYELLKRIAQIVIERLQVTRGSLLALQKTTGALPAIKGMNSPSGISVADQPLETLLENHPFVKGMKPEHLRILLDSAMKARFDKGELIFREGDVANRFYLLEDGKVILEAGGGEGQPMPIQVIGAGDVLGWSWLFEPFYWHFDARAVEATQCVFLYGTRLREECESNHDFGYELMKRVCRVLIQRLQSTRHQLLELKRQERALVLKGQANRESQVSSSPARLESRLN